MMQRFPNLNARPTLGVRQLWRSVALLGWLGLWPRIAGAQQPASEHSRAEVQAEVVSLEDLVRACGLAASACDRQRVPEAETVAAVGSAPKFTLRWDWLSDALDTAKDGKPGDPASDKARREAMQASLARLEELREQMGPAAQTAATAQAASFGQARSAADRILSRVEFDKVAPPSWWDRLVARFWAAVDRLFEGVGKLGARQPWLGKTLEALFFLGAAVGLLFFLRRNFQRQRLAANLRLEQAARTAWDRDATDWAALAESAAAKGDWRDAVHCLYWASIVRLESRRAWRHNPARTPREYVRLLKPGSVQRESLGGLTALLERVWYGLRPAGAEEYGSARAWFERLSDAGVGLNAGPGGGQGGGAGVGAPVVAGSGPA